MTATLKIPHINLLLMQERFVKAFEEARSKYDLPSSISITIHESSLNQLPDTVRSDTVVSPANSYGRLDGAFDDALSRYLSPRDDYFALTRAAQARLYEQWRGFAPPGTCTLVKIPEELHARSRNVWGIRHLALCPTMRTPEAIRWNREVVYQCIWSLLCAVDNHNGAAGNDGDNQIRSILMTPLGTGAGLISPQRWAGQLVLALKHFHDALEHPEVWSKLEWDTLSRHADEVQKTWKGEKEEDRPF